MRDSGTGLELTTQSYGEGSKLSKVNFCPVVNYFHKVERKDEVKVDA